MKAINVFRSLLLLFGLFCIATFCLTNGQTRTARSASAQTIPVVDLADIDFAVTVGADYVRPGEIVPFYLTITNTFSLPLEGIALVTTPPAHTTFSQDGSSESWRKNGIDDEPCTDGSLPGQRCSYTISSLPANGAVTVAFAVRIDEDIPASDVPISLQANIYAIGQGPTVPPLPVDPPSGQGSGKDESDRPSSRILYLPLIE